MKPLAKIVAGGVIVLSSFLPMKKASAQEINPFIQPNATTIYRGSGDVNKDGVVDANDYSAMQNDSLTCIQADTDIDGIPSTQNDLELLRQNLEEGKTLPSDWNNLQISEQRLNLDRKTASVNKLGDIQYPDIWKNNKCVYISLQSIIDQEGYYGETFPSYFDSTKNGQANLPTYLVSIFYSDTTGHAITAKVIGDSLNGDPRIWENWCFRDPQYPNKEVKIGDWSLKNKDSTEVRIEKINYLSNHGYGSDKFLKFQIKDSIATCTYYDTLNLVLEREDPTSIEEIAERETLSKEFILGQNYPNPFNPTTTIKYDLPIDSKVSLKIYNIRGQELETLVNKNQTKGQYEFKWTPDNLSSGIYFYRIQAKDFTETKKMIYLK